MARALEIPPVPGSLRAIKEALAVALPDDYEGEIALEESPGRVVVEIYASDSERLRPRNEGAAVVAHVRGALLADMPLGVQLEVRLRESAPAVTPRTSFAERMRRVRGDFGTCSICDVAFEEGEPTTLVANEAGPPKIPVHPGCVIVATCAGCHEAIHERQEREKALPKRVLIHATAECRKALKAREKADRARQSADAQRRAMAEQRDAQRGKERALHGRAIRAARDGKIAGILVLERKHAVESLALSLLERLKSQQGYLVSNAKRLKGIAFHDGRGQLVVAAYDPGSFLPTAYHLLAVEEDVQKKYPDAIRRMMLEHPAIEFALVDNETPAAAPPHEQPSFTPPKETL